MSVIHFCIRSLVRHLPNTAEHLNWVFSTCAVRKTKTLGTEWMLIVDWFIWWCFSSSEVEQSQKRPMWRYQGDLTEYHTYTPDQNKTKETKKLINPIGDFLCNKTPCFCHHVKLPAKYFHDINETEPFSVFVNITVLQFCIKELWQWWHKEGFH